MSSRVIVVGDIHGCYDEFMALLDKISPTCEDRIVCIGDLITKGPQDREVLQFVRQHERSRSILGNHERLLMRFYRGEKVKLEAPHHRTMAVLGDEFGRVMDWVSEWPHYVDLGDYLIVHAGVRPGRPLEKQTVEDLTELRSLDGKTPGSRSGTPWYERYRGEKVVIFGHWVFDEPLLRENVVGIDTGCVYGGLLTAIILPDRRLVSVEARRAYARKGRTRP